MKIGLPGVGRITCIVFLAAWLLLMVAHVQWPAKPHLLGIANALLIAAIVLRSMRVGLKWILATLAPYALIGSLASIFSNSLSATITAIALPVVLVFLASLHEPTLPVVRRDEQIGLVF